MSPSQATTVARRAPRSFIHFASGRSSGRRLPLQRIEHARAQRRLRLAARHEHELLRHLRFAFARALPGRASTVVTRGRPQRRPQLRGGRERRPAGAAQREQHRCWMASSRIAIARTLRRRLCAGRRRAMLRRAGRRGRLEHGGRRADGEDEHGGDQRCPQEAPPPHSPQQRDSRRWPARRHARTRATRPSRRRADTYHADDGDTLADRHGNAERQQRAPPRTRPRAPMPAR